MLTEMEAPMIVTAIPDRITVMAMVRNSSDERHRPRNRLSHLRHGTGRTVG